MVRSTILILLGISLWTPTSIGAEFRFSRAVALPTIMFEGHNARIHTQGLFATADHWIVTGRLENTPKRPLLIRISRTDPARYEVIDLLPRLVGGGSRKSLDHPGGFDRDTSGAFWIPVSTSDRRGPTVILGIKLDADASLANGIEVVRSFEIDDHVGALCCVSKSELLAANWDTKKVYRISSATGKIVSEETWQSLVESKLELAVQDWKFDRKRELVIAGGIDKSPGVDDKDQAVIAAIDLKARSIKINRLPPRAEVSRPLTNEGLALDGNTVHLLPEDFGAGAQILEFERGNPAQ
ncbi:MAG: hypothetical protein KDB27_31590 [Planctomycetales bacterium]|nr:hypothetical protein [Planctomycetales bacterium]